MKRRLSPWGKDDMSWEDLINVLGLTGHIHSIYSIKQIMHTFYETGFILVTKRYRYIRQNSTHLSWVKIYPMKYANMVNAWCGPGGLWMMVILPKREWWRQKKYHEKTVEFGGRVLVLTLLLPDFVTLESHICFLGSVLMEGVKV